MASVRVHTLPIPAHAVQLGVGAWIVDGKPKLFQTSGAGYHGVELFAIGPHGGVSPVAVLSATGCRELARALVVEAAVLELAELTVRVTKEVA